MGPRESSITGSIVDDEGTTEAEQVALFVEGLVKIDDVPGHLRDEVAAVRALVSRMPERLTQPVDDGVEPPLVVGLDGKPLVNRG